MSKSNVQMLVEPWLLPPEHSTRPGFLYRSRDFPMYSKKCDLYLLPFDFPS